MPRTVSPTFSPVTGCELRISLGRSPSNVTSAPASVIAAIVSAIAVCTPRPATRAATASGFLIDSPRVGEFSAAPQRQRRRAAAVGVDDGHGDVHAAADRAAPLLRRAAHAMAGQDLRVHEQLAVH